MKGIVFTEFLDMVDDTFGSVVTDAILNDTKPPSGGAYTAVGTYPCEEMVALVRTLEHQTGARMPELLKTYGRHLFGRFVVRYPELFTGYQDSFSMLENIDATIHMEVRKLYPDAELPRFDCRREEPDRLVMVYSSLRPFADLAHGLIEGCALHFGEKVTIERSDDNSDKLNTSTFSLQRQPM